ncbi:MAG: extracellular solute-binding protein [Hyphomicrobiaceae bacterium]
MISRTFRAAAAAALFALTWGSLAATAADPRLHALSLLGQPKFGPDFKHFDWVNPNAPKGGVVRMWALGSFDSLNPYTIKGSAATGLALIYDTLMASSPDEPSSEYGLVAEWVSHPADFSSVTFGLRAAARFHDGKPITPADVVFTFGELKKNHPHYAFYYKNVTKAEATGPREVTFSFDLKGNRELPQIVGQLPVLPKHFWEAKSASGEARDLARSTLEIPLGSGPYRIKAVDPGRSISYERVADYWAKDLPVYVGQWNFDELRYSYFRDRVPAFEAFKAGQLDFWRESSAKFWATGYDFDALSKKLVRREEIETKTVAPMQAFVMNLRRPQFQDVRVRRAFNLAFDFEWANKNLFFDQYRRVGSFFDNSELAARGLPQGRELELLQEVRDQVPPEVFTQEWKNPVNANPQDARRNLAEATKLLADAGYKARNSVLVGPDGKELAVEFLITSPDFERVLLPYKTALERLGVKASIRVVDSAQYQRREDSFDFDIIVDTFAQSQSPGNEQRDFWGSAGADREGSRNTIGIKNPAVDKLIERLIFAKDRQELVAATRALDRVLLWNFYVVPQWHSPSDRIATWDMFERPARLPSQSISFQRVWWVDAQKEKTIAAARGR